MLKILKQNAATLGVAATDEVMDSVIARSDRMLQTQTLNLDLTFATFNNDTGYFEVRLENLAGHKFPSGYPSRRAFVEFLVLQSDGDTLFKSGLLQPDYTIEGQNADYEPHYNVIKAESEAQIYEMVMADVNNNVTTILERGYQLKKDNRLTPLGFTTTHIVYDTTQIVGTALSDADFNYDGFEGSGTDVVHYHVPLNAYNGTIKVIARMKYQSVPPRYLTEMFSVSTPEIDAFEAMYNAADKSVVLIAADSLLNINVVTSVSEAEVIEFAAGPNPTHDGFIYLNGKTSNIESIKIFSTTGQLVSSLARYPESGILLPEQAGVYFIRINEESHNLLRVIRN
jgi:hypothetical protein